MLSIAAQLGGFVGRFALFMYVHCICVCRMSEVKPTKKRWTKKQLRASQGLLTQQAKTNIYSSQAGMTGFGSVRHGPDIRADDQNKEGEGLLIQPAKTNIYDSQAGTRGFGSVRHGADIRIRELYEGDDDEFEADTSAPAPARARDVEVEEDE